MFAFAVIFYLLLNSKTTLGLEPTCSPFHYEEKTLEKMIRQEIVMEKMRSEIEDIKHQVTETLKDLNAERSKIVVDLEKQTQALNLMKDNTNAAVAEMKARTTEHIVAYSAEIEKVKESAVTPTIIFKAYGTNDLTLTDGKVIIFTKSSLNIGNAYNNQTGMFVAPVGGSFLFTAQICTKTDDWSYYGIFLDERPVTYRLQGNTDWNSCSTFDAIVVVEKGVHVSVRCIGACSGDFLWENTGRAEISFAGILLNRS